MDGRAVNVEKEAADEWRGDAIGVEKRGVWESMIREV